MAIWPSDIHSDRGRSQAAWGGAGLEKGLGLTVFAQEHEDLDFNIYHPHKKNL